MSESRESKTKRRRREKVPAAPVREGLLPQTSHRLAANSRLLPTRSRSFVCHHCAPQSLELESAGERKPPRRGCTWLAAQEYGPGLQW